MSSGIEIPDDMQGKSFRKIVSGQSDEWHDVIYYSVEKFKDKPFFLYLAYAMPHVPIFCSDEFDRKPGAGLYGDVTMELDHGVGQVMDKLKEHGLEDNTIVMFTSDNGPCSPFEHPLPEKSLPVQDKISTGHCAFPG